MALKTPYSYRDWFPLTEKTPPKTKPSTMANKGPGSSPASPTPTRTTTTTPSPDSQLKADADSKGVKHVGGGYYSNDARSEFYKKDPSAPRLIPVPPKEKATAQAASSLVGPQSKRPPTDQAVQPSAPLSRPKQSVGSGKIEAMKTNFDSKMNEYINNMKTFIQSGEDVRTALQSKVTGKAPEGSLDSIKSEYAIMRAVHGGVQNKEEFNQLRIELEKDGVELPDDWWEASFNSSIVIQRAIEESGAGNIIGVEWENEYEKNTDKGFWKKQIPADIVVTTDSGYKIGVSLKKDQDVHVANLGLSSFIEDVTLSMNNDADIADMKNMEQKIQEIRNEGIRRFVQEARNNIDEIANAVSSYTPSAKKKKERKDEESQLAGAQFAVKAIQQGLKTNQDNYAALEKILTRTNYDKEKLKALNSTMSNVGIETLNIITEKIQSSPESNRKFKSSLLEKMHVAHILGADDGHKGALTGFMEVYGTPGISITDSSLATSLSEDEAEYETLLKAVSDGDFQQVTDTIAQRLVLHQKAGSTTKKTLYLQRSGKDGKPKYLPIAVVSVRATKGSFGALQMQLKPTHFWLAANKYGSMDTANWPSDVASNDIAKARKEIMEVEKTL